LTLCAFPSMRDAAFLALLICHCINKYWVNVMKKCFSFHLLQVQCLMSVYNAFLFSLAALPYVHLTEVF